MAIHFHTALFPLAVLAVSVIPVSAWAGTITAQGNVTALTDVAELQGIVGTATFDEGGESVALGQYAPMGMTFSTGPLVDILPGVLASGSASQPLYASGDDYFPALIGGGAVATGFYTLSGGAVTFTQPVTQFGLTGSRNGTQYITVWSTSGTLLGQVTWQPSNDSAFVGIDTMGEPIGMLTYGNDNLWAGATYDFGGTTIISDTWIWAIGVPCQSDADCTVDDNPCSPTLDVCDQGNCVGTPLQAGCCILDEDCLAGEICMSDTYSCVPDPDATDTGTTDTDTTTDTSDTTEGETTTTTDGGDSTTTSSSESTSSSTSTGLDGLDEVAEDTSTSDTADGSKASGCSFVTDDRGSTALFGLFALALLGAIARRRED